MTSRFFALLLAFPLLCPSLAQGAEPLAKVMVFVAVDCPIANRYAPELNRLREDYVGKKIEFLLVYPEPSLTENEVNQHLADHALTLPFMIDRRHRLVKQAGVTTTPEVAVFGASDEILYRGKIDNLFSDYGERRRRATETYLRDALDAILRGDKPAISTTDPIGCLIEELP
ncbi:MAG: redoxin family protein [Verrucomicrobiaceae bacterium]|nr:redoxin family protein [Verrucomicrobiaceae bacterium]